MAMMSDTETLAPSAMPREEMSAKHVYHQAWIEIATFHFLKISRPVFADRGLESHCQITDFTPVFLG
jgi:hypothetical protein